MNKDYVKFYKKERGLQVKDEYIFSTYNTKVEVRGSQNTPFPSHPYCVHIEGI